MRFLIPTMTFQSFRATHCMQAIMAAAMLVPSLRAQDASPKPDDESVRQAPWMTKLEPGLKRARVTGRPVLLRFDDENCAYCRALDKEIETAEVQAELKNWLLVKVDIDDAVAVARKMRVTGVPALRILSPVGRVAASQDGALVAEDLVEWLEESRAAAVTEIDEELLSEEEPNILSVATLSVYLGERDAAMREAAIRRLAPYPYIAARPVVESLSGGSLAMRLSALELLTTWRAPLGDIDPWEPSSINEDSLGPLQDWVKKQAKSDGVETPAVTLSEEELAELRVLIDRMRRVPADEVSALRERIARGGEALLPDVYERLKSAESDNDKERLTALRYRLVANQYTALGWAAGFDRLAAVDLTTRKNAADELSKRATADDERLLLELFSDPAPLVREISLRALRTIGSSGSDGALVKLLDDPEPNIRAAVLGLLAEKPSKSNVGPIVEYVGREKDPDLIVHAVRFLREVKGERAIQCLLTTLVHENWRIRAESAEAIGKCLGGDRYSYRDSSETDAELKAEAYASLVERLEDDDAFVVSRSAEALKSANLPIVIDPLAKVVERHPDLAALVLETMTGLEIDGPVSRKKINNHLISFTSHEKAPIRAAAISAVTGRMSSGSQPYLEKALGDTDEAVRIAAADGIFTLLRSEVPQSSPEMGDGDDYEAVEMSVAQPGFLESAGNALRGLFGGGGGGGEATIGEDTEESINGEMSDEEYERLMQKAMEEAQQGGGGEASIIEGTEEDPGNPLGGISEEEYERKMLEADDEFEPAGGGLGNMSEEEYLKAMQAGIESPDESKQGDKEDDKPIETPENLHGLALDKTLAEVAAGKLIDDWFRKRTETLTKMSKSESRPERVAAARVLTGMGMRDVGLPILREAIESDAAMLQPASEVLQWLPWVERSAFFDQLMKHADDEGAVGAIAVMLGSVRDDRSVDKIWAVLEREDVSTDLVQSIEYALTNTYTGRYYLDRDSIEPALRRFIAADAQKRMEAGSYYAQLVALRTVQTLDPDKTYAMAQQLLTSAKDVKQKSLGLAFVLFTAPKAEATQHAVDALKNDEVEIQRLGLQFVTSGTAGISSDLISQQASYSYSYGSSGGGKPIIPELPAGVTADMVRPFVDDEDPELRARAAYALVLLAESTDIRPILAMRALDDEWNELAYRAIAFVDEAKYMPLLTKMYEANKASYEFAVSDFYWTIRIMSGPEALALRKRIREEKGMDELR